NGESEGQEGANDAFPIFHGVSMPSPSLYDNGISRSWAKQKKAPGLEAEPGNQCRSLSLGEGNSSSSSNWMYSSRPLEYKYIVSKFSINVKIIITFKGGERPIPDSLYFSARAGALPTFEWSRTVLMAGPVGSRE